MEFANKIAQRTLSQEGEDGEDVYNEMQGEARSTMSPAFVPFANSRPTSADVRNESQSVSNAYMRDEVMESKLNLMFARLLLYPIILIIFLIPGSVVRVVELTHESTDDGEGPHYIDYFSAMQRFCDPARGWIIALVWVFSDVDLCNELKQKFQNSAFYKSSMRRLGVKKTRAKTTPHSHTVNPTIGMGHGTNTGLTHNNRSMLESELAPGHHIDSYGEMLTSQVEVIRSKNDSNSAQLYSIENTNSDRTSESSVDDDFSLYH